MLNPKILGVQALDNYKIKLIYATGEIKIFDVAPYIRGSWYGELKDKRYFSSVHVVDGGYTVEWGNGQDLAPHELYEDSVPVENYGSINHPPAAAPG